MRQGRLCSRSQGDRVTVTNAQIRNRVDSICPSCERGEYTANVTEAGVQITNGPGQTFTERNWEHADAVVLVEDNGKINGKTNSAAIVEKAFKSYRGWFEKVVKMGLKRARELKLDPLEGSGVRWL